MSAIKLKIKDRMTIAGETLLAAATPEGVAVDPMKGKYGSRNFPSVRDLEKAGLIEAKPVGPRGGRRFFITPKGVEALKEAGL